MEESTDPGKTAARGSYALREELLLLREEFEKLKSEKKSRFDRFAIVLGIVGGILGIAAAALGLPSQIEDLFARPDTTVNSQELAVTYQPGDSTFSLQIPLVLNNQGAGDDIIKTAASELIYSPGTDPDKLMQEQTDGFNAGVGQFTFYDKEKIESVTPANQLDLPIYVGKKSARPIAVAILFDKGTFTKAGLNRLNVDLVPQRGKPKTASFCFYLDNTEILDLQNSATGGRKRFLTSSCGE